MASSLGAISFESVDLILHNEFAYNAVAQSARVKLNGAMVVQNSPLLTRKELVFGSQNVGGGFSGYFLKTEVVALKALEASQTTVTFTYESQTFSVVLKAGGIDVTPILPRPNQADTDYYTGTITMIQV